MILASVLKDSATDLIVLVNLSVTVLALFGFSIRIGRWMQRSEDRDAALEAATGNLADATANLTGAVVTLKTGLAVLENTLEERTGRGRSVVGYPGEFA